MGTSKSAGATSGTGWRRAGLDVAEDVGTHSLVGPLVLRAHGRSAVARSVAFHIYAPQPPRRRPFGAPSRPQTRAIDDDVSPRAFA
jgi:hypothetical protein